MTPFTPMIVGIAGGSASGKSTFAFALKNQLGEDNCAVIFQDSYYHDQSDKFDRDGGNVNFDHPDSIDFQLLSQHLQMLKSGQMVDIPVYDFKTHRRLATTVQVSPRPVILVDGILILSQPIVRQNLNASVFIHTSEEVRFMRRLDRDVQHRGRTEEGVKNQFFAHVKPMHDLYVEPSKVYADRIISGEESFDQAVDDFVDDLKNIRINGVRAWPEHQESQ